MKYKNGFIKMSIARTIGCTSFIFLMQFNALAQVKDLINLECTIERTIQMNDGSSSPTSSSDHVLISRNADGSHIIIKNNREQYITTVSDNYYRGVAEYDFSGLKMTETISINRYTGRLEIDLKSKKDPGIRHLGFCNVASKKF